MEIDIGPQYIEVDEEEINMKTKGKGKGKKDKPTFDPMNIYPYIFEITIVRDHTNDDGKWQNSRPCKEAFNHHQDYVANSKTGMNRF